MPDLDIVEQRLAALGVDVYDIKKRDAFERCVYLLDRCENSMNNLTVALEEEKAELAKEKEARFAAEVRCSNLLQKVLAVSQIVSSV